MLLEQTLMGTVNKVEISIMRLKEFEPPEGYYLAFSGGKDSICIYQLALMSGVKFDAHFNFTTVDPPELLRFIRKNYPDVIWEKPEKTMWQLIEEKYFPPTCKMRYCCNWLKERSGEGRFVLTGIRHEESTKRKGRKVFEFCNQDSSGLKKYLNPIIDWTKKDVWEFIRFYKLPYCCLYDEGYERIGCILCPMASLNNRLRDIKRYPNFVKAYKKAFRKMLDYRIKKGKKSNWKTAEDVMNWWLYWDFKGKQDEQLFETENYHYE